MRMHERTFAAFLAIATVLTSFTAFAKPISVKVCVVQPAEWGGASALLVYELFSGDETSGKILALKPISAAGKGLAVLDGGVVGIMAPGSEFQMTLAKRGVGKVGVSECE